MRDGMRRLEVLFNMLIPIGLQAVTVRLGLGVYRRVAAALVRVGCFILDTT